MNPNLNKQEIIEAIEAADALLLKHKFRKVDQFFTDTGRNARSHYPKHMKFFEAGKTHNIRGFIGGNGTGKSYQECIETYFHLSGQYPTWWTGYRFKEAINAWMCAREAKALREGIQEILFGGIGPQDIGTGIIPREDLLDEKGNVMTWSHPGAANCIGSMLVKHYTDGEFDGTYSKAEFKTYAQGWQEFQGPTRQWITLDEEPDDVKIYAECSARTRPKDGGPVGHIAAYFTPTQGYSNTYLAFVPGGVFPHNGEHVDNPLKYTEQVTWDDVPHLPDSWKASQIAEWKISDPGNVDARTKGTAAMGSGRVYPIDESFVIVPTTQIPSHWPRCYAMDPGASNTAVVWIAMDPDTGVKYVYDEYKNGRVLYLLHSEAVKTRGEWIEGGIDPHEACKPRDTGETVQTYFESTGLRLVAAKGDPDAWRAKIRAELESGALKIMDRCQGLISEIRTYRFDMNDPNKIAKNQEDHRCDAMLYARVVFDEIATSKADIEEELYQERHQRDKQDGDSERSNITGY